MIHKKRARFMIWIEFAGQAETWHVKSLKV